MKGKPRRKAGELRKLGFEGLSSLIRALRVDEDRWCRVLEQCENGYPYKCWREPKRSGKGHRLIEHPEDELKAIQRRINALLQRLDLPNIFHGCYARTSILTNARPHLKRSWFLSFDLANYYKEIRPRKVYEGLVRVGASPDVARALTRLTTIKGRVPQGAPSSPIVAVIAMLSLAERLKKLAGIVRASLTIYGDNVCLSGTKQLIRHRNTILRAATSEGFRVRAEKTFVGAPGDDKPLPGLIIREGEVLPYDEDLERVGRCLDACLALKEAGLSRKICSRFVHKLRGIINHYTWINTTCMRANRKKFETIPWPAEYAREPCWSPKCHCTPVNEKITLPRSPWGT